MQQDKVSMYLMTNSKYFPPEKIFTIQERLKLLDEDKMSAIFALELKDPTTFLIISIFGGCLGIDRFMLGDVGIGILKLLTLGVCGILTIIDWCMIQDRVKQLNFNALMMWI